MPNERVDVGVIGAGVHGASAAFHLASRGARIAIFETRTPAGGPTGRSSAVCRAYYSNPYLAKVARESLDMFADWSNAVGGDAGYRRTGALFLHPPEDVEQVEAAVERLDAIGTVGEVFAPDELRSRFPPFQTDGLAIVVLERDAGYADPAGTTFALFRAALERGATAKLGCRVERVEPRGDGGADVRACDGSTTTCDRLLIAAGPWTKPLAAQAGGDLPLTVERHIVVTFAWGGSDPVITHADIPGGYYFRPEGADLCLMGPMHEEPNVDPDRFDERLGEAERDELAARLLRRVPAMERAELHGGWASLYDVSPDWQPVIGQIAPGVFVDAGTSGHGFKLAPALGKYVASMVVGEDVPGLEEFSPRRFDEHRAISAGYGDARILG
jgi:sarcosine oxidase, subunit beta